MTAKITSCTLFIRNLSGSRTLENTAHAYISYDCCRPRRVRENKWIISQIRIFSVDTNEPCESSACFLRHRFCFNCDCHSSINRLLVRRPLRRPICMHVAYVDRRFCIQIRLDFIAAQEAPFEL